MEAFDLAFIFTEGDLNPMTTDLLLLIKVQFLSQFFLLRVS
jgi:hypothetical protein